MCVIKVSDRKGVFLLKKKMLALVGVLAVLCSGCGANSAKSAAAGTADAAETMDSVAGYDTAEQQGFSSVRDNAKLIIRANLELESQAFEQADEDLQKLVAELGGYLEQSSTYGEIGYRSNSYTARIPQKNFESFMTRVGDTAHILSKSQSKEDVTDAYVDNEIRLKTLNTKQERLLALLEKATSMDSIVALENALAENEYQIEQLSAQQRTYDRLVDFATIDLSLAEVRDLSAVAQGSSFGAELKRAAQSGAQGVVRFCRSFILYSVAEWPLIVLLLLGGGIGWRIAKKRRLREKKSEKPEQEKQE